MNFSQLCHAAYTLATPGFTHTLTDMHAGSLRLWRLTSTGGTCTTTRTHPLCNISQFHNILADSKALGLTRHETEDSRLKQRESKVTI